MATSPSDPGNRFDIAPQLAQEPIVPAAYRAAIAELQEFVSADGANLIVRTATERSLELDLDLAGVECIDCVLPADILAEIVNDRLHERLGPDVQIQLYDSRATMLQDPQEEN